MGVVGMKLGYWGRGGKPLHTHIMAGHSMTPQCGCHANLDADLTTWHGGILAEVDCGNCLRVERAKLRRGIVQVERRMAGRDAKQMDALL